MREPKKLKIIGPLLVKTFYSKFTQVYSFVQDHCQSNGVIADEQARGKSGSWGRIDQLLINKAINEDVKKQEKPIHYMARLSKGV